MTKQEFALLVSDNIRHAVNLTMDYQSVIRIREEMIEALNKLLVQFLSSSEVNDFTKAWAVKIVDGVKAIPPTDNKSYLDRLVVKYLELGLARRKMVEQIYRVGRK